MAAMDGCSWWEGPRNQVYLSQEKDVSQILLTYLEQQQLFMFLRPSSLIVFHSTCGVYSGSFCK